MRIIRIVLGFVAAVAATTVLGSLAQTHMVTSGLVASGAELSPAARAGMSLSDIVSLGPSYAPVIAVGFAVGFLVAALLRRVLKPLAPIAYPLAGAAAIAAALKLMPIALDLGGLTILAGTRGALGFALQCLAGAVGGLVFALIIGGRRGV